MDVYLAAQEGTFGMKSHLSEDTDDENCDDPIRLFDNNINAVYFGSQQYGHGIRRDTESHWTLEQIGNDEFCQPIQNSTLEGPDDDLIQMLRSSLTSKCDTTPLSVKLVDCGKFPWYFRKYTQQIMQKINSDEPDSENEIDVEGVADDSDDCFIVEDLQDVANELIKNDQNCKIFIKRQKDEDELQKALSIKNMVKVDFKRNQGLVGMKITPKLRTNTTLDVKIERKQNEVNAKQNEVNAKQNEVNAKQNEVNAKQKSVMADEKAVSAADRTISHVIGTQLIPLTDDRESKTTQFKINHVKDLGENSIISKSFSSENVTAQLEVNKICEKYIDNLKTKRSDQSSEGKTVNKVQNTSLLKNPESKLNVDEKKIYSKVTIKEKNTNLSTKKVTHVKNVKITNKYKNDQIKIKNSAHNSWIGQLVKNNNKEDIKEMKCTKQRKRDVTQSIATKPDKKPRKKTEKQKNESKSPILHCSTVPKKPKHEIAPKCNKSDINSDLAKEPTKVNEIVDRLFNLNSCNLIHEANQTKHVVSKVAPATKPHDIANKKALQKESNITQDKTTSKVSSIHTKSLIVSDKLSKNKNEVNSTDFRTNNFQNAPITPSSQNMTNEQNLLRETQDNVIKHKLNTFPITNRALKAPNKNNKPVSNSYALTTTVITPTSGPNSVPSNQNTNFPYYGSHFSVHNASLNRMSDNKISNNNINVPVQNRYASAIILKSNNHTNFPCEKFREPPKQPMAPHPQKPINILLSHSQQRFKDPQPPFPIFYPPAPSERLPSNIPSPANSFPNQFHPPHGYIAQQPRNPMQDFYRECWLPQNLVPPPPPPPSIPPTNNFPRNNKCWLPQNLVPPPPPPPSAPPTNNLPRNSHDVTKSKNCSYLNRPSASVMQNPQSISHQNSINTIPTKNSSIIGMNTNGLVKKINIVAMPAKNNFDTKKGTLEVEQTTNPQIMSSPECSEVVATKTEMLKELDKLSFVDENLNDFKGIYPGKIIGEDKKENTLEVAIMSKKRGSFETLKFTMNKKDNHIHQTKSAKGYSPPILPIPTYQKVLDQVLTNLQTQNAPPNIALRPGDPKSMIRNETKPMRKRDFVKCCKRKFNNTWNIDDESKRKEDAKKISLDEYKKRIVQNGSKPEQNKRICKEKYNHNGKRPNIECKLRKNVDYNTETDLGYDSDSTVVL